MKNSHPDPHGWNAIRRELVLVGLHLLAFLGLRSVIFQISVLEEDAYEGASILASLLERGVTSVLFWSLIAVCIAGRRFTLSPWNLPPRLACIRWFATGLALTLFFAFGTQDTNLYFGQSYLFDRLVLLVLAISVWARPIFILPLTAAAIAMGGQFSHPLAGHGWDVHYLGIFRLPIHLLLLILLGVIDARRRAASQPDAAFFQPTVLLILVITASGYWVPGITKLRIGWATVPNVHFSLFGAWCHGWLSGVSAESIAAAVHQIGRFAIPLQIATVVIECGSILILRRRAAIVLLSGWILFHAGAMLLYGYFFWLWVLVDASLLIFVFRRPDVMQNFRWQHAVLAALLVASSSRWLSPNRLAWFNAPLSNSWRLVAETDSGRRIELQPEFFAPYDNIFVMGAFEYLSTANVVSGPYATTMDPATATTSGPDLVERQRLKGHKDPSGPAVELLAEFLKRSAINFNRGLPRDSWLTRIAPPPMLKSTRPQQKIEDGERITRIQIHRVIHVLTPGTIEREDVPPCLVVEVEDRLISDRH